MSIRQHQHFSEASSGSSEKWNSSDKDWDNNTSYDQWKQWAQQHQLRLSKISSSSSMTHDTYTNDSLPSIHDTFANDSLLSEDDLDEEIERHMSLPTMIQQHDQPFCHFLMLFNELD